MFDTVFGALLVVLAVCVGVGLPVLSVHFQERDSLERRLHGEIEHQREIVDAYRDATRVEPEQLDSLLATSDR